MCTAAMQDMMPKQIKDMMPGAKSDADKKVPSPEDVPLGEGLADAAKTSILSRRERIRRAVEGE